MPYGPVGLNACPQLSRRDTALYSKDLIHALRAIATRQRQFRLAELLDAAAVEAERLLAKTPERNQSEA